METIVDADLVKTFTADSKGRINLGTEYAGAEVEIAVERKDKQEKEA